MFRTHPDARRLLYKLRTPPIFEGDLLARRLRAILGTPTAREAFLRVVDVALAYQDPRARVIIERCDIDGLKIVAVASELNLSARQVFRYRSVAVEAIARVLEELGALSEFENPRFLCPRCQVMSYSAF